jgi:hypothetical protein
VRPLISVSVKNETTERHGSIDDQGGMVCGRFVFANVPVAHRVTEAGQSPDDADEARQRLFRAVADLRVFGREIQMLLHPLA